ncbi:Fe-S-binding domain-containing protein [Streptomyces sioyaensis]|uniref:NADH-ubiquinone oxidoreductase-F iron-sulfur binding region domain-containing protein n=1 Tax=Streptomyces sioyaensis TaxID=67364 RepID=UPI001F3F7046|nr:NADH-ubiquinone oxidoreductase-F iron-sulfur binding region domain-containing protein [Streptomyces sioyaensis]MCF3173441.1 Fe-S-binding domain-containing protein [Streptomyces sioyaensis]
MTRIDSLIPRGTPGVLGAAPGVTEDAETYDAAGGYRGTASAAELLAGIDAAGLRGRGGAGHLTAAELRAVRDAGDRPVVVANGEEGEPGSVKDRWLLRARPHLVLDGLLRAAEITGARRGYVYLSDAAAGERVRRALAERPPRVPVEVVETRHTYGGGEESAVVRRIHGGPTAPSPRPHGEGIDGAPTLVANVETLARVALIAARPDGRRHTARSTLVTLAGGGTDPLLAEVPYGCTLRALARAQGTPEPAGVLMGGPFGGLIGPHFLDLALGPDTLAVAGAALGCGAIRFLAPEECPVSLASAAVAHLAAESARQCGSCVTGTGSIRDDVGSLTTGTAAPGLVSRLHRRATALPGRGACGLLDAAARTAGSLLRAFPHLVRSHLDDPCPACAAPAGPLTVAVPRVVGRPVPGPRSTACPG